ncbi:ABC transporter permease [Lysinibacter cavernae]|uniref:ABC-type nitrate/sulfonate/bicarbonate transport system permease component n=1 Tax=Lysinibacter cavernae TaxID=1640652 RepID=A0A7X5TTF5_9MICO|nr:ABC transporter permease [Lysinibacter cavernae]NIH53228.1 ABC-type nitrate/sulfonate/bicarbonate transport system permease component [Lysinibacter cavernae]
MTLASLGKKLFYVFAVPIVIVIFWIVWADSAKSPFWPSPVVIAKVFPATWLDGRIQEDVVPSLIRFLTGYLGALILGVMLGMIIGSIRRLRYFLEPTLEFFRAIPPPVLVPIVMLFAGIGDGMKVIVIIFGCIWPILLNTIEGVRGIDGVQLDTARSYRINGWRRTVKIILPSASPQIFIGARQALSIGLIMMVISEMFAATNGIGFNIVQFQRLFALPEMWSGIILLGVIGVCANALFRLIEGRVLTWYFNMQVKEK